ncbi:MAG: hypothetical protein ATN36_03700 [Epulopiscium sp. Nele67-Bin005]|nr:MAG: hypothetical protein ATN36_03700 [Epulopiscium sp. Nele67-Bin005]
MTILMILGGIALIAVCLWAFQLQQKLNKVTEEAEYLTHILDAIPHFISVTDNERKWTFVNKATAISTGRSRQELIGKSCSEWNSEICGTPACGINSLHAGKLQSFGHLDGHDYNIDVAYIKDKNGKSIGHLEFAHNVSHVTALIKTQDNLLKEIAAAIDNFGEFASIVGKSSHELSSSATSQANVAQQFIDSIVELSESLEINITKITETNHISTKGKEKAHIGREHMENLISNMEAISKSSKNISDVIKIIENIAEQTNLLALNAAIESARAGEAGKGFAVVSSEIRDLAIKSSEIVKEIEAIINDSLDHVEKGQAIVKSTADSLVDVVQSIEDTAELSQTLLENSKSQQNSINKLNNGTRQLSSLSEANVASAEENLSVNNNMVSQIEALQRVIEAK